MRKLLAVPVLLGLIAASTAMAQPSQESTPEPRLVGTAPPVGPEARVAVSRAGRPLAPDFHKASKPTPPPKPKPRPVAVPPHLQAIASCESGGDPSAVDSTGTYRGKYQFSVATWQGVGGSGDPAAASEAEQDKRAAMLYARSGPGQWPVCGQ